jgi:hypothetical protein
MVAEGYEYPDPICQDCGESCGTTQEVEILTGVWELWCYCQTCDIETNHPIPEAMSPRGIRRNPRRPPAPREG